MARNVRFKQVKKGRLSDSVLSQLKKSIISGVYQPGDKLPSEKELLEMFNVSRGSLREALRTLEEFGFIVVKPGASGGAYVRSEGIKSFASKLYDILLMEKVTLDEICQFRMLVEPDMARMAAENRTDDDIRELEELIGVRERGIKAGKIPIVVNIDFHQALARTARNKIITLVIDAVALLLNGEFRKIGLSLEDHDAIVKAHKTILGHIANRDGEEAARATREHVADVTRRLKAGAQP